MEKYLKVSTYKQTIVSRRNDYSTVATGSRDSDSRWSTTSASTLTKVSKNIALSFGAFPVALIKNQDARSNRCTWEWILSRNNASRRRFPGNQIGGTWRWVHGGVMLVWNSKARRVLRADTRDRSQNQRNVADYVGRVVKGIMVLLLCLQSTCNVQGTVYIMMKARIGRFLVKNEPTIFPYCDLIPPLFYRVLRDKYFPKH